MKLRLAPVIVGVAALIFGGSTQAASAAELQRPISATSPSQEEAVWPLSEAAELDVREFFDKFDVPAATQNELIDNYEAGQQWDSLTSDATPASVEVVSSDGVEWTVNRFEDGSVRADGIGGGSASLGGNDDSGDSVVTLGVDGCGYSSGAYGNFFNCHIYYWVGLVQLGFYANFSINSGANNDQITTVWGGELFAGGGCSQSVPTASIVKGTESSTGPAVAGLTAQATTCVTNGTINFPSYLHVGGNQATHVYS